MIKNFKDIVIFLITTGVLILLAIIIVGDYLKVALEENRPVDEICHHINEDERHGSYRRNRWLYRW
jgi:hypothetical protein